MPSRPAFGSLRKPLSFLLGTRAKVDLLRVLTAGGEPVSQRELARRAQVQHRSTQSAVDDLVTLGVVNRIRGGRDYLVSVNPKHYLADRLQHLFNAEASGFRSVREDMIRTFAGPIDDGKVRFLGIFGSAARDEDKPASDLDVLAITTDASATEDCHDLVLASQERFYSTFGVHVNLLAYTLSEARRRSRRRLSPLREAQADAIVIHGPPLTSLLEDG